MGRSSPGPSARVGHASDDHERQQHHPPSPPRRKRPPTASGSTLRREPSGNLTHALHRCALSFQRTSGRRPAMYIILSASRTPPSLATFKLATSGNSPRGVRPGDRCDLVSQAWS